MQGHIQKSTIKTVKTHIFKFLIENKRNLTIAILYLCLDQISTSYSALTLAYISLQLENKESYASVFRKLATVLERHTNSLTCLGWNLEIILISERDETSAKNFLRFVGALCRLEGVDADTLSFTVRPYFSNAYLQRFKEYVLWISGSRSSQLPIVVEENLFKTTTIVRSNVVGEGEDTAQHICNKLPTRISYICMFLFNI